MRLFLFLLIAQSALAAPKSADLHEKTFPRDNTFCQVGKERVEFSLRGYSKYTETKDRGYGEILFYKSKQRHRLTDISEGNSGLYRFFMGNSTLCSKGHALLVDPKTFALVLQKANRPLKDKLTIKFFDTSTLKPIKVINTEYLADKAIESKDGFFFRTNGERLEINMGTITWDDKKFTYQDRDFQEWMKFDKIGFTLSPQMTYQQSPYKAFFKDESDFLSATGWNTKVRKFEKKVIYVAVNHSIRKECVLILAAPQKLTGSEEGWRCQSK